MIVHVVLVEQKQCLFGLKKLSHDQGSIALTDEYVNTLGLPSAQRFPWDDRRGMFFLNVHHSLHCLVCNLISNMSDSFLTKGFSYRSYCSPWCTSFETTDLLVTLSAMLCTVLILLGKRWSDSPMILHDILLSYTRVDEELDRLGKVGTECAGSMVFESYLLPERYPTKQQQDRYTYQI